LNRSSISDVARKAGVSKTTVSHVINHTRVVEEDTRQRVLDAIRDLGYRPNILARSLTTKRTGIIGMVISDGSNVFFGNMLKGVEELLLPANYGLLVCNTNEILERESHYLNLLLGLNVDGIIAAATSQEWGGLSEAERQNTPIVFVDRRIPEINGPFIGVDNEQGAYLGTSHLIERAYQRIGILSGFDRLSSMRERTAGFRRAMEEHHLPVKEEWIAPSELSIAAGQRAMRQLMMQPDRPEAVFINNNLLALGALLELKERGLRCPQEIGIVMFDDHPWAAVSDPPLTVVSQPSTELGKAAARLLLEMIRDGQSNCQDVILPCELIVRNSC
jgi:LacI family transcriptional regulator